jgi:hypothetical protein
MNTNDVGTAETERSATGLTGAVRSPVRHRIVTVVVWALVFTLWATTRQFPYLSALLFVLLGASALFLTTVAAGGWDAAMFRTTRFREAAARAVWTTGAMGTIVFFESVLFGPAQGLAVGATRLALSFVPSVCSCALATGLLAWTLRAASDVPWPRRASLAGSAWDLWVGRILFAVLVGWPLLQARWSVAGPRLVDSVWMMHWPAVLVLVGTLAGIRVIGGARVRENAASVAVAGAGTLTALAGLLQALLGVAGADVASISAGISFFVTACFTTLLGLALVTFPRDDRVAPHGAADGTLFAKRTAWVLFPLVTVGLMAIAFILILTPMPRRL